MLKIRIFIFILHFTFLFLVKLCFVFFPWCDMSGRVEEWRRWFLNQLKCRVLSLHFFLSFLTIFYFLNKHFLCYPVNFDRAFRIQSIFTDLNSEKNTHVIFYPDFGLTFGNKFCNKNLILTSLKRTNNVKCLHIFRVVCPIQD